MRDVSDAIQTWLHDGLPVALATVVSTWGSAPRVVGSRMAVTTGQRMVGSVSGGCVEAAIVEAAGRTLETGECQRLAYGVSDATAWSVGLACGGQIEVVVERLDPAWFEFVQSRLAADVAMVSVLVVAWQDAVHAEGSGPALGDEDALDEGGIIPEANAACSRWTVAADGAELGSVPQAVHEFARAAVDAAMTSGRSELVDTRLPDGGTATLFIDAFPPRPTLVIFGAVHIAVALVSIAKLLGYRTWVVDPRASFASPDRFAHADQLLCEWPDTAWDALPVTPATAIAVLSHDPKIDDPALVRALDSQAFYVGALGSRKTQGARRERLGGLGVSEAALGRLNGPIGLDIGAQTPEEVALAVMAEVVAHRGVKRAQSSSPT